jgi:hypothetical protein
MAIDMKPEEVADIIEAFLDGRSERWDWDDFVSIGIADPTLESVRLACVRIQDEYPAERPGQYCNDAGAMALRALASSLRVGEWRTPGRS